MNFSFCSVCFIKDSMHYIIKSKLSNVGVTKPLSIHHPAGDTNVEMDPCRNGKWVEAEWIIPDTSWWLCMKVCFMTGNHREHSESIVLIRSDRLLLCVYGLFHSTATNYLQAC